ncbi:GNAT family N-acetyltransferase [Antribacter gilvus]|uniref:GNAT family N-acetyltransferase n=1 Tax=Antribacter gilvus TaxID=2304675 RepID=UPI000F7967C6|nr:GNAT family N-acetyltransferase [Antribacter gilvus]
MPLAIRHRTEADLPVLAEILVRVHALDGYPVEGVGDPEAWLRHPRELRSWTAEVDGRLVGQVTLTSATPDDDAARVWRERTGGSTNELAIPVRLFADPRHRGSGAGRALMTAAVDHARRLGLAVAFDVMLKDRAAVALYERMGAVLLGEVEHVHSGGLTEAAAVYRL